jgi:hypothetical protein
VYSVFATLLLVTRLTPGYVTPVSNVPVSDDISANLIVLDSTKAILLTHH